MGVGRVRGEGEVVQPHLHPGLLSTATHRSHPQAGTQPRPLLREHQRFFMRRVPLHSPLANHHKGVGGQLRAGEKLSVLCHLGRSHQASGGKLDVFLRACSVSL